MREKAYDIFSGQLAAMREAGTYKDERIITTPQQSRVDTTATSGVLYMCANNYLGLADNPEVIAAAKESYDRWGFGLSSVRFICGTQQVHKQLEQKLSAFFGFEDAILYSSCFDANGGLFEALLTAEDAIISDELNHASIIDGVRLCKAARYRYKNNDMADLREKLEQAKGARIKLIATDGVFSMDGYIANLRGICDLADEYGALVMVDDSHAAGFVGKTGRGTIEHCGVQGRVDILTGTFGKALGGVDRALHISGVFLLLGSRFVQTVQQPSAAAFQTLAQHGFIVAREVAYLPVLVHEVMRADLVQLAGRVDVRKVGQCAEKLDVGVRQQHRRFHFQKPFQTARGALNQRQGGVLKRFAQGSPFGFAEHAAQLAVLAGVHKIQLTAYAFIHGILPPV